MAVNESIDLINDPRTRELRMYANRVIDRQISIQTRLRDLRVDDINEKIVLISGVGALTQTALASIAEGERRTRFRSAVRAEEARLVALDGATPNDGVWPNLNDFEMRPPSAFWLTGPGIAGISGLQDALNLKMDQTAVDARFAALIGAAPGALDTLQEIAAALSDNQNAVEAIMAAITTEASSRQSADTAEASTRAAADTANANAITAEAAARLAADNAEIAAREAAINAIPAQQPADWNATSGVTRILNKPTLGSAASQNSSAFAPASEASDRASADAALASQITSLQSQVSALTTTLARKTSRGFVATGSKVVVNTAVETSLIPTIKKGNLLVPAAAMVEGTTLDFKASGFFNAVMGGAIVTLRLKMGALQTGMLSGFSLTIGTNLNWQARGQATVRAGNFITTSAAFDYVDLAGKLVSEAFTESTVAFTPGVDYVPDFTAQWAVALLGSSLNCTQLILEVTAPPA